MAGDGPYNAHLMGDAGVGFLAAGVVLLLATIWMDRRVVQAALVATVVHGAPHLVFHFRHPNDALSGADALASSGSLVFGSLLALVLLVAVNRSDASAPQIKATAKERTTT